MRYNNGSVVPEIVLVYASGATIGQPITGNATDMVSVDNKAIVVGNEPGAVLPHTGGSGARMIYLLGGFFVLGAWLILMRRKRTI